MTTTFDSTSQELSQQAALIDKHWRIRRKVILGDVNLSAQGQRTQLAELDAKRRADVAALQERAAAALTAERNQHAKRVAAAKLADVERRVNLLGKDAIVRQHEARVPRMTGQQMIAALDAAVGVERDILIELCRFELAARLDTDAPPADVFLAWNHVTANDSNTELARLADEGRDLANADRWVEGLDLDGARRHIAGTFGVSYEATLAEADRADGLG